MEAVGMLRDAAGEWWRNWLRLTVLNLVWMVSWLTIVLGPPVTFAVYSYLERLTEGDEMTIREFLLAVKENALKGWLWAIPVLLSIAFVFIALPFYAQFPDVWARAAEVAAVLMVLGWLFLQFYALPFLFTQETRSLRLAFRNAAMTSLASPLYSMIVAFVLLIVLLLSIRFMALTFFFTPILVALAGTLAVKERLRRFGLLEGA